jgi:hypothetical protein
MLRTWLVCIIMAACALIGASCAATAPLGNPLAIADSAQATTQMAQATYNAATQIAADVAANLPAPTLTNFTSKKTMIVDTPTAVVIVENGRQVVVLKQQTPANPTK